jgi:hypothetical protein
MSKLRLNSRNWSVQAVSSPGARRGARRSGTSISGLPAEYLAPGVTAEEYVAQPAAARRGAVGGGALDFSCDLEGEESAILAIRHPSGALTFHLPIESERRGAGKARQARFSISVQSVDVDTGRRGPATQAIKAILIKVGKTAADKALSVALPKLAGLVESNAWKKNGLSEGWFRVTQATLASGKLQAGVPASPERTLLFLHGTFSNAASAFGSLAKTDFFQRMAPMYGDRIYAFNHFTVSRSPGENARMLLKDLAGKPITFDVITHSRGGLVLRNLAERGAALGSAAEAFQLGRAVLVASPNDGTPLASPLRWHDTVGWLANLLELFPDNPFTTGAEFVANGLVWLARHLSIDLPGLYAMDPEGGPIGDIQAPPGPPAAAYSALVSNYSPSASVVQRMVDVGVDQFFAIANDLVVPSEGGWRVDHSGVVYIPAERIGCYGPGGNLPRTDVTHVNFFSQPETPNFLVNALAGEDQRLKPVDPAAALPSRKLFRGAAVQAAAASAAAVPLVAKMPEVTERPAEQEIVIRGELPFQQETLYLSVLQPNRAAAAGKDSAPQYILVASFRNASAVVEMKTKGGDAGQRYYRIIQRHRRIRDYMSGTGGEAPPLGDELIELGEDLFDALLPEEVRRLYDNARAVQSTGRLTVIFSSHNWLGDLPWEFVFDRNRQAFLATSEVNFTRNIVTAVPADLIEGRPLPLRILVVVAQPMGLAHLSVDQEIAAIKGGFTDLKRDGLVETEVLLDATPEKLHHILEESSAPVSSRAFDIVHFIGHGEFDSKTQSGYLIFEDEMGRSQQLDSRSMQEIFCRRGIRLVFLNACETAEGGPVDFNSGLAQSLVAGGMPCVVANQYSVMDVSATSFAQHFYWSLARGNTIGDAERESRIAVNYSIPGPNLDWAVPVVYARNPDDRLATVDWRASSAAGPPLPAPIRLPRGAGFAARRRVGLWDMQHFIPDLDKIAAALTTCQNQFAFEAVSLPLGTWRRKKVDGHSYLEAEEVVKRLEKPPFGVDILIAITGLALFGDKVADLQTYRDSTISVLSLYGCLDQLKPPATTIERLLSNAIAELVTDLPIHKPGAREGGVRSSEDCPLFYNPENDLRYVAGPLKLCALCRKRLTAKHNKEMIRTVEALLDCY